MGKKTVKKRVFMSNAMMLLVISIVFLIIRIIITEIGYQIARQQVEVYTPQSWQEPMEHFGIINRQYEMTPSLVKRGFTCHT